MYYDPWRREKADRQMVRNRASATRVLPDDLPPGCIHENNDIETTPCDTSREYYAYTNVSDAPPTLALNYDGSAPDWSSLRATPYAINNAAGYNVSQSVYRPSSCTRSDVVVVRGFLEEAEVINPSEPVMSIA